MSTATLDEMVSRILYSMFRLGLFDPCRRRGGGLDGDAPTPAEHRDGDNVAEEGTGAAQGRRRRSCRCTGPGKRIAVIGAAANEAGATLAERGTAAGTCLSRDILPAGCRFADAGDERARRAGRRCRDLRRRRATADAVAAARRRQASRSCSSAMSERRAPIDRISTPTLAPALPRLRLLERLQLHARSIRTRWSRPSPPPTRTRSSWSRAAARSSCHGSRASRRSSRTGSRGQVDGDAIAPVLFGDVDPSGSLPETFPVSTSGDGPFTRRAR